MNEDETYGDEDTAMLWIAWRRNLLLGVVLLYRMPWDDIIDTSLVVSGVYFIVEVV